jgi:hypothetical protein
MPVGVALGACHDKVNGLLHLQRVAAVANIWFISVIKAGGQVGLSATVTKDWASTLGELEFGRYRGAIALRPSTKLKSHCTGQQPAQILAVIKRTPNSQ